MTDNSKQYFEALIFIPRQALHGDHVSTYSSKIKTSYDAKDRF